MEAPNKLKGTIMAVPMAKSISERPRFQNLKAETPTAIKIPMVIKKA
jgi:hypothetical protein